jgi:hypothetical protein
MPLHVTPGVPRRDAALSLCLFRHGSTAARRAGLPRHDWGDCAITFAAYMLGDKAAGGFQAEGTGLLADVDRILKHHGDAA